MTAARDFDVVLFGATGFTGRLVAEYLAGAAGGARVALAGRDRGRLESVRGALAEVVPGAGELPLVVADAGDGDGLRRLAGRTRVVCTTVGPYQRYGAPLVAACADAATHYCDITGEVPFIRQTIDRHHRTAAEAGVRLVHCCGFDSIPSDLGTWLLHRAVSAEGGRLAEVQLQVLSARGGFSGGTVASMLDLVEAAAGDRALRRLLADPYALNPEGERSGPDRDRFGVRFDDRSGRWTAPFVMAAINSRVVRRSNALLDFAYGRELRYSEVTVFPSGPLGAARAAAMTAALGGFVAAIRQPLSRAALRRWALPAPGEGPDAERRARGRFRIELRGRLEGGGERVATVADGRDPGYGSTAVMLAESALCLAGDDLATPGGVLTPATAMGDALVQRLRAAGLTFEAP